MYTSYTSECKVATGSRLSPCAASFVPVPTYQTAPESKLSAHAADHEYQKSPKSKLSAHAATFVAAPTNAAPDHKYQTSHKSNLSAHAATFVAAPTTTTPNRENVGDKPNRGEAFLLSLDPALRALLTDGVEYMRGFAALKKCVAAVGLCQAALGTQYDAMKQQEELCNGHCIAYLKWKHFERYDELCTEQDTECIRTSAEAREFRCTKCGDTLLDMQRAFDVTTNAYLQLVAEHDLAVDEYGELTRWYNASVVGYYGSISGRTSPATE